MRNAEQAIASEKISKDTVGARWRALVDLLGLDRPPARVECFDISHTRGEATVASCVVFDAGGPVKAQYRRYNIEGVTAGDDYAAMRQALDRRFRRAMKEHGALPDVLLIDGGRGQVAQADEVLAELAVPGCDPPPAPPGPRVHDVASSHPAVRKVALHQHIVGGARGRSVKPRADEPALHLIQWVRDEAHRFAIGGNRARRQKARERSALDDIAGVGARRRSLLLRHFGGLAGVQGAGVEELTKVPGIDRALAQRIYDALHG